MTPLICARAWATLLGSFLLFGCSQRDPAPAPDAEARLTAAKAATDDPCALLNDDEVSTAFPGAASGKRDRSLEGHGILTCTWETPTDRFVVQTFDTQSGSVEDELRSRVTGSIDPTRAGAGNQVRYEAIDGIGDDAMLVLETADPNSGVLADTAVLVTQRGARRAVLFTGSSLAAGDRADARRTFETLGRQVAERL